MDMNFEIEPSQVLGAVVGIGIYIAIRFEWFCRRLNKVANVLKRVHPTEAKDEGL